MAAITFLGPRPRAPAVSPSAGNHSVQLSYPAAQSSCASLQGSASSSSLKNVCALCLTSLSSKNRDSSRAANTCRSGPRDGPGIHPICSNVKERLRALNGGLAGLRTAATGRARQSRSRGTAPRAAEDRHGGSSEPVSHGGRATPRSPGPGAISYKDGPGVVSFHEHEEAAPKKQKKKKKGDDTFGGLGWVLGPLCLVAATAFPPVVLRPVLEYSLGDTILTDFIAIFLTDFCFTAGAALFLYLAHTRGPHLRPSAGRAPWSPPTDRDGRPAGLALWAAAAQFAAVALPLVTILLALMVGTVQVATAAFAPYLALIAAQLLAERAAARWRSPARPLVPIVFTVFRLHQLNRGAQLVGALAVSLSTNEAMPDAALAAAASLSWFLAVLQIVGLVWVCDLGVRLSFLPWQFSNWYQEGATSAPGDRAVGPAPRLEVPAAS